jgi:copper chaperone CopZ
MYRRTETRRSPMAVVAHFGVPRLIEVPAGGSGCCVIPASTLLRHELSGLRGVHAFAVDDERGAVTVTYDPAQTDVQTLCSAMADVDYPARVLQHDREDSRPGGE